MSVSLFAVGLAVTLCGQNLFTGQDLSLFEGGTGTDQNEKKLD